MSETQEPIPLTAEQLAAIEAIKAIPADPTQITLTPTEPVPAFLTTPVVTETQTPEVAHIPDIQPTMPHSETVPTTGETIPVHPAVGIIAEIESHLTFLSLYGSVENNIRKLVQDLKSFF